MRLVDALLGRTKRKPANLDALFGVPTAAITLQAEVGLRPIGQAAVSYKPASGPAFSTTADDVDELLRFSGEQSGTTIRYHDDTYGYRWVVLDDPDIEDLVGSVHLVNRVLTERGFGPQLLCSVVAFGDADGGQRCHLVYLYKRGTFYPFAPREGERRDNELELRVRGALEGEVPVETELSRWFPLWGLPLS